MLDRRLRPLKDRLLGPLVAVVGPRVGANALTVVALLLGVSAAASAAAGVIAMSVGLWVVSRVVDGLDGPVARSRGESSDAGGYADLVGDSIVYVSIPLGVAVWADQQPVWIATGVLVATFYVNAVSLLYLAALIEKRGARTDAHVTSVNLPGGVVEGAETFVLFTLLLAFPGLAMWWMWAMATLVVVTIVQRTLWTFRHMVRR